MFIRVCLHNFVYLLLVMLCFVLHIEHCPMHKQTGESGVKECSLQGLQR